MFPKYPSLADTVRAEGEYPKLSLLELGKILDEFNSLGLQLLPKRRDNKLPVWSYWNLETAANADYTREGLMRVQQQANVSGWCIRTGLASGRLYVVDIDPAETRKYGNDPEIVYETIQALSRSGFVLGSPAKGVHIYYRVPDDLEMLTNAHPPVRGVDGRGEGGQVVTLGGFNRYDGDIAEKKGVANGHTAAYYRLPDGDYSSIPLMSMELYDWLTADKERSPERRIRTVNAAVEYSRTERGSDRTEAHRKQPVEQQVSIVIEALSYVLAGFDELVSYEEWYKVWMSAHDGSNGDRRVRDYILNHPSVYWRDGKQGRKIFYDNWSKHKPREAGGYTVASLFYLAQKSGWLSQTGYEIDDSRATKIAVDRISDWMLSVDPLPEVALLMSQTGSGKTQNLIAMWQRLNRPKTVVFVPSIKLATELAGTLVRGGMPAQLYLDPVTGKTRASEELRAADVLVTTLQTFSNKVYQQNVMKSYGLVYIEESDQLIQQFARGGGGLWGSHVREIEARVGFQVLREALEQSAYVWAVDATMSKVTAELFAAVSPRFVELIINTRVAVKAPVTLLAEREETYTLAAGYLSLGKKVVVVADTAAAAEEFYMLFQTLPQYKHKNMIVITSSTERRAEVIEFMQDVNKGAMAYDLICYNSVMASGVSITAVKADVVIQIANYLTPRLNLQMLNRFRKQELVFVYYSGAERLYGASAEDVLEEAQQRSAVEARLVGVPVSERRDDAKVRAHLAAMSVADVARQMRSPKQFYTNLLRKDGRYVKDAPDIQTSVAMTERLKAVREARRAAKDELARTWPTVRPITREHPAEPDMTEEQVKRGVRHGEIYRALNGHIPDDEDPETVSKIVDEFGDRAMLLDAFVSQSRAVLHAERLALDREKAITGISPTMATVILINMIPMMYHELGEVLTPTKLRERAPVFMAALTAAKEIYDTAITRGRQKYDLVNTPGDVEASAAAFIKIILRLVGLKQISERGAQVDGVRTYNLRIMNVDNARKFLEWRSAGEVEMNIVQAAAAIQPELAERQEAARQLALLSETYRNEVYDLMEREHSTSLLQAITAVEQRRQNQF